MKKKLLQNCLYAIAAAGFILVVWLVARFAVGNELLVPSPWGCLKKAGALLIDGEFWYGFGQTLGRVLVAFAISFLLALVFAVVAYTVPVFGRFCSPVIAAMRTLPTLAAALVILVWCGAANAPVAVAFLSLFPTLYAGISAALSQVDSELIEMSRVYKVPVWRRIFGLYLPSATPYVLRESGAALSFSLKLVVSAEVLANTYKSLGGMMQEAKVVLDVPLLFALVCVAAVTGILLESAAALVSFLVERGVK